jgi:hypothetical protein
VVGIELLLVFSAYHYSSYLSMPSTHDCPVPVRSVYPLKPDTGEEIVQPRGEQLLSKLREEDLAQLDFRAINNCNI